MSQDRPTRLPADWGLGSLVFDAWGYDPGTVRRTSFAVMDGGAPDGFEAAAEKKAEEQRAREETERIVYATRALALDPEAGLEQLGAAWKQAGRQRLVLTVADEDGTDIKLGDLLTRAIQAAKVRAAAAPASDEPPAAGRPSTEQVQRAVDAVDSALAAGTAMGLGPRDGVTGDDPPGGVTGGGGVVSGDLPVEDPPEGYGDPPGESSREVMAAAMGEINRARGRQRLTGALQRWNESGTFSPSQLAVLTEACQRRSEELSRS